MTGDDARKLKPIELKNGTMLPTWAVSWTATVRCWAMAPTWEVSFSGPDSRYSSTPLAT